jgi:hypothetical protein
MFRVSTEFAQLVARGTTAVTGSGDWGVGCDVRAGSTARLNSLYPYLPLFFVAWSLFRVVTFCLCNHQRVSAFFGVVAFCLCNHKPVSAFFWLCESISAWALRGTTRTGFVRSTEIAIPEVWWQLWCVPNRKRPTKENTLIAPCAYLVPVLFY